MGRRGRDLRSSPPRRGPRARGKRLDARFRGHERAGSMSAMILPARSAQLLALAGRLFMRTLLLFTGVALLLAASTAANAADIYAPAPEYSAAPPPPLVYGAPPPPPVVS